MPTEQHIYLSIHLRSRIQNCQEERHVSGRDVQKALMRRNINVAVVLEMSIILTKTNMKAAGWVTLEYESECYWNWQAIC